MGVGNDIEVKRLLDLAHDKSVAGRERLAAAVADLFQEQHESLSTVERALMLDIFHRLVTDVERSVRAALAHHLSTVPGAPRAIVKALAEDSIEVAHPILVHSPVLSDPDLIEIIHHRTLQHRLAIALRAPLNSGVCDALVATGNTEVMVAVVENDKARISPATMALLVERARRIHELHPPLVRRGDLDPVLARRLIAWVSAALRDHLVSRFGIAEATLDTAIEKAAEEVGANRGPSSDDDAGTFADYLASANAITPQLLIQVLRHGDISLFETLLVRLTGLRITLVRRMLYEPGGEGLATLCRACGIGKPDFASIFVLSRSARPEQPALDSKTISTVLAFFDATDPAAAKAAIERMRRDPDYLKALRQLNNTRGRAND